MKGGVNCGEDFSQLTKGHDHQSVECELYPYRSDREVTLKQTVVC